MQSMPIFRQNGQIRIFWPKFGHKWIFSSKLRKQVLKPASASLRYYVCKILDKTNNLDFFGPNLPKKEFKLEIQKTNVGIRISILEIPCVPIFRQNGQLWLFGPKLVQNWILGSEFQKSKSGFGISILETLCAPIFR